MILSKKRAEEIGREVLQEFAAEAIEKARPRPVTGVCVDEFGYSMEDALPKEKATCLTLYSDGSLEIHIGASIAILARWAKKHEVDVYVTHWAEVRV